MHDNRETRRQQALRIQQELNSEGLSRRALFNRLSLLGAGFGAAYILGAKAAEAGVRPDAVVNLKSTDPALNRIIEEGRPSLPPPGEDRVQLAQYGRVYGRAYPRVYGRGYPRVYNRVFPRVYSRGYPRVYGRVYPRVYGRGVPFLR